MTEEECVELRYGDIVWTIVSRSKVQAMVVKVCDSQLFPYAPHTYRRIVVGLRRMGRNSTGRGYPIIFREAREMTLVSRRDPTTANVFADFLDERGYNDAAAELRKEFPIT